MTRGAARELLRRLSGHNALLGGAQLAIQLLLAGVRQLLLLAAPLSGGLSLAPAAPVALAQAALAVATTRRTGRLAALALLRGSRAAGQPGALLRRLAQQDAHSLPWLQDWPLEPASSPAAPARRPGRRRPAPEAGPPPACSDPLAGPPGGTDPAPSPRAPTATAAGSLATAALLP